MTRYAPVIDAARTQTPPQTSHTVTTTVSTGRVARLTVLAALLSVGGVVLLAFHPLVWWIGVPVAAALAAGAFLLSRARRMVRVAPDGRITLRTLARLQLAIMLCVHLAVLISLLNTAGVPALATLLPAMAMSLLVLSAALGAQADLLNALMNDQRHLTPGRSGAVLSNPAAQFATIIVLVLLGLPTPFLVVYSALVGLSLLYLVRVAVSWVFTVPADRAVTELR